MQSTRLPRNAGLCCGLALLWLYGCGAGGAAVSAGVPDAADGSASVQPMDSIPTFLPAWAAADRIIGLLTLPELFGAGPCDSYVPAAVHLFPAPDSAALLGVVRVDSAWTHHENGGCEGLSVNVHLSGADSAVGLPTLEYEYEAPAAVVLGEHGRWFRIRLADGSAWLRAAAHSEFLKLEQLLVGGLSYIVDGDGAGLAAAPGQPRSAAREHVTGGRDVNVLGAQRMADEIWLHVELLSHSPCESGDEPTVIAQGWIPAHAVAGDVMVWFYSRGC